MSKVLPFQTNNDGKHYQNISLSLSHGMGILGIVKIGILYLIQGQIEEDYKNARYVSFGIFC